MTYPRPSDAQTEQRGVMSNAGEAGETGKSVELPPMGWNFDNSYARLPESLFVRATPATVRLPRPNSR